MKIIFATIASLLFLTGCVSHQTKIEQEACRQKAMLWLGYLDEGNGDQLWENSSIYTKNRFIKDEYIKSVLGLRDPLGKLIKRTLDANWVVDSSFTRLPDNGVYRRLMLFGKYENKRRATEQLYMSLEDGEWKVIGWKL